MDNSLSKALIIAAGVLLAMVVVAFMMYSFREISSWSTTQNEEQTTEQIEKFNKEYEAFDKDLMYGVDVISCLNKAKSNNDKVEAEGYSNAYLVKVNVTFKKKLSENIRVYYVSKDSKKEKEAHSNTDFTNTKKLKLENVFEVSKEYKDHVNGIDFSKALAPTNSELSMNINQKYQLYKEAQTDDLIKALLAISGNLKQMKQNSKYDLVRDNWTRAEWETPAFSMKTRKFKCTNVQYNAQTSRVDLIEFEEF